MCHGKVVRNSHSRVDKFLLSRRMIMACLLLLHSISQWFSIVSLFRELNPDLQFC